MLTYLYLNHVIRAQPPNSNAYPVERFVKQMGKQLGFVLNETCIHGHEFHLDTFVGNNYDVDFYRTHIICRLEHIVLYMEFSK